MKKTSRTLSKLPCWQCGSKLWLDENGKLLCEVIAIPGSDSTVRVHKLCKENALNVVTRKVYGKTGATQAKFSDYD